ncbi:hypothetical protein P153DRAFT_298418 [Dothidotthia symphoricarpi CBS 119687]|uniref:Uncharacterized protein n=1 Tax=Dothidotthia symphoricarpi CBS 119687 TaxID=1392245 RepID=A0A6A6A2P3_9PLEO|nr:uncharacterized protein P153DRAFT_298418 [Dothidotthia symphoricarpi CBS 119687]KAF2126272.1 hypothetical protein P153DRAFT_298418 [Dothidotthia symphoricarpi CBS 119687]
MKLLTLISPAFLAASVSASASESASEDPTPVGQLWTASWTSDDLAPYEQSCHTKSTYKASIYKLGEMYPALEDYTANLKMFYSQQLYPGSWAGYDAHGNDRELLKMPLASLPTKMHRWLQTSSTQRHFSVHDDVVFFAPGAIYPLLPLWVNGKGECEGAFAGLEEYANEPRDGAVIGKVDYKKTGEREVEFSVEGLKVQEKEGGRQEL